MLDIRVYNGKVSVKVGEHRLAKAFLNYFYIERFFDYKTTFVNSITRTYKFKRLFCTQKLGLYTVLKDF